MTLFNAPLNISALPLNIIPGDKNGNIRAVESALEHLPAGTDIVVLPELFSTGYSNDSATLKALAERNTQQTIDCIKALAAKHSVAIAGSYLASTPPGVYNRAFFIEPSGEETFYDKKHLFSLGNESEVFRSGDSLMPVVRFRGWNIAMIVCYDLRFPVWCRNRNYAYDLLLVVANWPKARAYAWQQLLIARAIENQSYVVGANRSGSDEFGVYDGLTAIYDCRGFDISTHDNAPFVTARLSKTQIDDYRAKFPAGKDADNFEIFL